MAVSQQEQNIRRARGQVRQAVQAIREVPENREWVTAQTSLALRELAALRDELADETAFKGVLERVGFDAPGAALVIAGLNDTQGFQQATLAQLAQVPVADITTARLMVVLRRHIESPECRQQMKRRPQPSNGEHLDPTQEFAPFLDWLYKSDILPSVKAEALTRLVAYVRSGHAAKDLTDPNPADPTVVELKAVMAKMREGKVVEAHEVDGVFGRRFAQLFVPLRVEQVPCQEGKQPVAMPINCSLFSLSGNGGSVEGAGCVDALIRDAKNDRHWHLAAATSADNTRSQHDQLARHHQAVRNRIDAGMHPFTVADDISSLSFVSPALLMTSRQKALEGDTGPALSAAEIGAINSLSLLAQLGHSMNIKTMRTISVLQFQHFATGGPSAAQGGFGLSEQQLVVQSAAHWARAAQALGHADRDVPMETGANRDIIAMLISATKGLLTHFPADAEKSLRQSVPALTNLSRKIADQGLIDLGDELQSLTQRIKGINAERRERQAPTVGIQPADVSAIQTHEFKGLDRHQQYQQLLTRHDWSPDLARRWAAADTFASESVWDALGDGTLQIQDLDAHRAGLADGRAVLELSRASQGQWLRHFKTRLAESAPSDEGTRFFKREEAAQQLRMTRQMTPDELTHLVHIQRSGADALWNVVVSQAVSVKEAVEAVSAQGKALLDLSEQQQTRWVTHRAATPTGVRKRLLEAEPVSDQHADFLKRVRPALEEGALSDPTLDAFDRVAQHGSARLYQAVMLGTVSALNVVQSVQRQRPVLDLPKSAQNDWLRRALDRRVTDTLKPAAVIIQEAQDRHVEPRRRRHR